MDHSPMPYNTFPYTSLVEAKRYAIMCFATFQDSDLVTCTLVASYIICVVPSLSCQLVWVEHQQIQRRCRRHLSQPRNSVT